MKIERMRVWDRMWRERGLEGVYLKKKLEGGIKFEIKKNKKKMGFDPGGSGRVWFDRYRPGLSEPAGFSSKFWISN